MAHIQMLSEVLANQIAAGEVVERPASVVKELVENAIDAHAQHIDIMVEEAGIEAIRVIDDGDGIPTDQVQLAFQRHATSKILTQRDLVRVSSLGFRGEALPSIASVSDVHLVTAQADASQGMQVHYEGGHLLASGSAPARKGTDVTVKKLFFNTPARLKYLKSQATELAKIVEVLNHLALSYPQVALRLRHGHKEILRTVGNGDLQQVLAAIYGVQQARKMLALEAQDNDFRLNGYTSLPELTRANRSYIAILINGRFVKHFQLTNALLKGYGSKLMVGRYPIAALRIDMDPTLVDVNVHPQKNEVRLSKESELQAFIEQVIRERIGQENLIPDGYQNYQAQEASDQTRAPFLATLNDVSRQYQANQMTSQPLQDLAEKVTGEQASQATLENAQPAEQPLFAQHNHLTAVTISQQDDLDSAAVQGFVKRYQEEPARPPFGESQAAERQQSTGIADDSLLLPLSTQPSVAQSGTQGDGEARFPDLTYIGQVYGTFLLAQGTAGLYIIDQHAAQERIKYEHYRAVIGQAGQESQQLLVPIVLEYSALDALKIEGALAELAAVGIELAPFGEHTFILREHPGWFPPGQEEATVREMIDWLLRDQSLTVAAFRERTAIMMACKRSIKANWSLNRYEAQGLIDQLAQTENPFNCPHGRPVLVSFSLTDMEKMFKRIQDRHESWVDYDQHPF